MAASPSQAEINAAIRRNLKKVASQFGGSISTDNGKIQLLNGAPDVDGLRFAVSYDILRASNGEVALMPVVEVWSDNRKNARTFRQLGIGVDQARTSFKAEKNGTRVFAAVATHTRFGAIIDRTDALCVSHDLLEPRRAQIAAGNHPDLIEAMESLPGKLLVIREVPYASHEANEALKLKHGADCFTDATESRITGLQKIMEQET